MSNTETLASAHEGSTTSSGRKRSNQFARMLLMMLVWMIVCWGVIGWLLAPYLPGGWLAVLVLAVVTLLPLAVIGRGFGGGGYPSAATRLFIFRPFWYAQLLLPLSAAGGLLGILLGLPFGAAVTVGLWGLTIMATLVLGALIAGFIGSRWLVVRRFEARFDALPAGLDGVRIVQLSDLHVGPHTSRWHLSRIIRAVGDAEPDLIAITGDQVDDYGRDVERFAATFGELAAPLGVFAIAGNHDIYAGWDRVRDGLREMGATVLVNEALPLEHNGTRFWVAGTGDPAGRSWSRGGGESAAPDLDATLAAVPPEAFTLVLAHNPALWPGLAERGADLTLSGHTHHGQLSIPRLGWSLASPFLEHAMGSHRKGRSLLYINPGTNFWGIPFRIGALPEVTVVILRRGEESELVELEKQ
jgi:predicted MPP superfamily phosphohydrolase